MSSPTPSSCPMVTSIATTTPHLHFISTSHCRAAISTDIPVCPRYSSIL